MKYLGIDYGEKRIGLAISDDGGSFAFPYKVIRNNSETIDTIHNICGEEGVGGIVLGEPESRNKIFDEVFVFKEKLEKELGLPVYLQKEFMTSVHGGEQKSKSIFSARKEKSKNNEKDDSKAATLILERYLEKIKVASSK